MPNKTPQDEEADLARKIESLREKLQAIADRRVVRKNKRFLGKCYVFYNDYGADSPAWKKYFRVTRCGVFLTALSFEKTSTNEFKVEESRYFCGSLGYEEISREEFDEAWSAFLKELNSLNKK